MDQDPHYMPDPVVGTDTMTKMIEIRLSRVDSCTLTELANLLHTRQFYVLKHLWMLKITGQRPDLISKVTEVDFTDPPTAIREALKELFPQTPLPEPTKPADITPKPRDEADEKALTMSKRRNGSLMNKDREFVEYIRENKPKTLAQLARTFGVDDSTVRRKLYCCRYFNVNLDIPRKVIWAHRDDDFISPYVKATLGVARPMEAFPIVPGKEMAEAPVAPVAPPPPPQTPVTPAPNSMVSTLERLVLENVRSGEFETVKALAQAIRCVEASKAQ
jgi:hypothetical protein